MREFQTVVDTYTWSQTNPFDANYKRLTQITDANGNHPATYEYNEDPTVRRGAIKVFTDAIGITSTLTYVNYGHVTQTTTIAMPTTSYETNHRPTALDTFTVTTPITGTRNRLVLRERLAKPTSSSTDDMKETYTYDGYANVISTVSPRGYAPGNSASDFTTTYCYDVDYSGAIGATTGSHGNLTRLIAPRPNGSGDAQLVTLFSYDSKNNTTKIVPPEGVKNSFEE